ncbi:MAG: hypothetical protein IT437_11270 [Phycisphaerales bacterium]|nr:hypothetical protein [Phycisphaerales bacterium]
MPLTTLFLDLNSYFASVPGTWVSPSWEAHCNLGGGCTDSPTMLDALSQLWARAPATPAGWH